MDTVNFLNFWDPALIFTSKDWGGDLDADATKQWLRALGYESKETHGINYSMPHLHSADETQKAAKALTDQIWRSHDFLARTMATNERKIQDYYRLHLTTCEQRAIFLDEVYSQTTSSGPTKTRMPTSYRPDTNLSAQFFNKTSVYDILTMPNGQQVPGSELGHMGMIRYKTEFRQRSSSRLTFLCPELNHSCLDDPALMLSFLHHRAWSAPHAFWRSDRQAFWTGWTTKLLRSCFLPRHAMVFHARVTPDDFGELRCYTTDKVTTGHVQRGDADPVLQLLLDGDALPVGEGMLLLEHIQAKMHFLENFCLAALRQSTGIDEKIEVVMPTQELAETQRQKAHEEINRWMRNDEEFTKPYKSTRLSIYAIPENPELGVWTAMADARVEEAKQHAARLRKDPIYFRKALAEQVDHHWTNVRDPTNTTRPCVARENKAVAQSLKAEAASQMVIASVESLEIWTSITQKLRDIEETFPVIMAVEDRPFERQQLLAFAEVDYLMRNGIFAVRRRLTKELQYHASDFGKMIYQASASYQTSTSTLPSIKEELCVVTKHPRRWNLQGGGSEILARATRKVHLMELLLDDVAIEHHGIYAVTDLLLQSVQNETWEYENTSPLIRNILQELACLSDLLRRLESHFPLASKLMQEGKVLDLWASEAPVSTLRHLAAFRCTLKDAASPIADLDEAVIYPVEQIRTPQTVDELRKSEQKLGEWWGRVDDRIKSLNLHFVSDLYRAVMKDIRSEVKASRTPTWKKHQTAQAAQESQGVPGLTSAANLSVTRHPRAVGLDLRGMEVAQQLFGHGEKKRGTMSVKDFTHFMRQLGYAPAQQTVGSGLVYKPTADMVVSENKQPLAFHVGHKPGASGGQWESYQILPMATRMSRVLKLDMSLFFLR